MAYEAHASLVRKVLRGVAESESMESVDPAALDYESVVNEVEHTLNKNAICQPQPEVGPRRPDVALFLNSKVRTTRCDNLCSLMVAAVYKRPCI